VRWLVDLPTTNTRIVVSLVCVLATAWRVLWRDWAPDVNWLLFLGGMAGLDVLQYVGKRTTWKGDAAPDTPPPPSDR
jgi:hypothetical protein